MYTQSVIPDYVEQEKKPKLSKKKKRILIISICLAVVVIIGVVIAVLLCKKIDSYREELRQTEISFEELDAPEEERLAPYKSRIETGDYSNLCISSNGKYAAYETETSYQVSEKDSSEAGSHMVTEYAFTLHVITAEMEVLDVKTYTKQEGRIELLGVTNWGGLVCNDTEKNVSLLLTDGTDEKELGDTISAGLFYENGDAVFLTEKSQLCYTGGDGGRLVSSRVSRFGFLNGKEEYRYVWPVEKITSTDSTLRNIVYVSGEVTYGKDLNDNTAGGTKWEGRLSKEKDLTLYDKEMNTVNIPETDVRGCGSYELDGGELIFRYGIYHRNLGRVDEVLCLAGDKVYVMRDGKLLSIDCFSKEEEQIADHKMQVIIR